MFDRDLPFQASVPPDLISFDVLSQVRAHQSSRIGLQYCGPAAKCEGEVVATCLHARQQRQQ